MASISISWGIMTLVFALSVVAEVTEDRLAKLEAQLTHNQERVDDMEKTVAFLVNLFDDVYSPQLAADQARDELLAAAAKRVQFYGSRGKRVQFFGSRGKKLSNDKQETEINKRNIQYFGSRGKKMVGFFGSRG